MRPVLCKLSKLTSINWWEFSLAYLYLLRAWWKLSIRKEKLERWVLTGANPAAVEEPPDSMEHRMVSRRSRWVNLAARYPWPWALCLQRSLALCLWLDREDLRVQLRIGVRKRNDSLEAHAWVEYHGRVLNDRQSVSRQFALMNMPQGVPSVDQLSKVIRH